MRWLVPALVLASCAPRRALDTRAMMDSLRSAPAPTTQAAPSVSADGLDPEQAVALALERHPGLAAVRRDRAVATGRVEAEHAIANPTVTADWKDLGLPKSGYQFSLKWRPPQPFERDARITRAEAGVDEAEQAYREQQLSVAHQVRETHARLREVDEEDELAKESLERRRAVVEVVKSRAALGAATQLEVLAAQGQLLEIEHTRAQLSVDRESGLQRFRWLLALGPSAAVALRDGPPAPPADGPAPDPRALEDLALASRPALAAATARYAQVEESVRLAYLKRVPWFRITAGPQYGAEPGLGRTTFDLGVELYFPVWDWNGGAINEEEARRARERDRIGAELAELRYDIASAVAVIGERRKMLLMYRDQLLPALDQREKLVRQATHESGFDLKEVMLAEDAILKARRQYAQAKLDYQRAWLSLDRAVGSQVSSAGVAAQ